MLITYKKTLENCDVNIGDECEVYIDGEFHWIKIYQIDPDGYIRALDEREIRVDFPSTEKLFDAIGDV